MIFSSQKTKLIEKDPDNIVDIYNIYFDLYSKEIAGINSIS